jgi:hypothetical protein
MGLLLAGSATLAEDAGGPCCGITGLQRQSEIRRSVREVERLRRRALSDSRITLDEEQRIRSEERRLSRLKARLHRP